MKENDVRTYNWAICFPHPLKVARINNQIICILKMIWD